jgi:hypothetical protein
MKHVLAALLVAVVAAFAIGCGSTAGGQLQLGHNAPTVVPSVPQPQTVRDLLCIDGKSEAEIREYIGERGGQDATKTEMLEAAKEWAIEHPDKCPCFKQACAPRPVQ